jgi:asparagine synthase (glutamine-hydrolysing)
VEQHLLSDVPVASFLSGGIDSSIVTALAAQRLGRNLKTFSVGFDVAEFDESAIALEVAQRFGTTHQRLHLADEEGLQSVKEAVAHLDLPSVDAINTYIVSRAVAQRGVKVALSGLGGDELFGGYPSFRDVPRLKRLGMLPRALRKALGRSRGRLARRCWNLRTGAMAPPVLHRCDAASRQLAQRNNAARMSCRAPGRLFPDQLGRA